MVRFKNRYLLCVLDTELGTEVDVLRVQPRDILNAIRSSLSTNFGDLAVGQSMSSLAVKLWSPVLALCIVRCSRDHFRAVWAAVSFIIDMAGFSNLGQVRFTVIHIGGTIRACQKSAAQQARTVILDKKKAGKDPQNTEEAAVSMKRQIDAMEV